MQTLLSNVVLILMVGKQWPRTHSFLSSNSSVVPMEASAFAVWTSEEKQWPPPQPSHQIPSLTTVDRLRAETALQLLIKRFVSEFSSNKDSVSSRCSKASEKCRRGVRSDRFKSRGGPPNISAPSPAVPVPPRQLLAQPSGTHSPRSRTLCGLVWKCL